MKNAFALLILFSCSRLPQNARITSFPEGASVATQDKEGKISTLGTTPLETQLPDGITDLIISKEGFGEERILVMADGSSALQISAKLRPKPKEGSVESGPRLERLARDIVRAHNLIGKKSFGEARSILTSLSSEYPYVSVTYDLLGNVSYLERDSDRALSYYEKSLSLNPENIETRRMVERLKGNP